jgi:hypothetical protein
LQLRRKRKKKIDFTFSSSCRRGGAQGVAQFSATGEVEDVFSVARLDGHNVVVVVVVVVIILVL